MRKGTGHHNPSPSWRSPAEGRKSDLRPVRPIKERIPYDECCRQVSPQKKERKPPRGFFRESGRSPKKLSDQFWGPRKSPAVYDPTRGHQSRQIASQARSEEHTSELQSRENLVCRLLLEKKN